MYKVSQYVFLRKWFGALISGGGGTLGGGRLMTSHEFFGS